MKRTTIAAALLSLVFAANAQVKDRAVAVQETEAVVTVTKVDKDARMVTFRGPRVDYAERYLAVRGPKGNVVALKVAEDLDMRELSVGDRISVTHTEALAVEMVPAAKRAK
jgi:hypothetical protein